MKLAYDPTLVRALARSTAVAIDGLAAIRSHDPAAGFAIDSVRAAGRHLEHDWMPLLSDIVTSTAMTQWWQRLQQSTGPTFAWQTTGRQRFTTRPNRYESMSDDDLLRLLYADGLDHAAGPGWSAPDFSSPFWAGLPELAAELARRSARPDFATRMIADVHILPLVAMSVPLAEFDVDFVSKLAVGMLSGPPIQSGATHRLHEHGLDAVMRHLMFTAPEGALDVLANPEALVTLGSWERLDQQSVRDFVRVGLYDSVATGRRTIDDGIGVIATMVELANGPFDRGVGAGVANGFADSMFGYVHTIAHGINDLHGSAPVKATDELGEMAQSLGTFADMRDFFGVMVRHDEARATLATVLGAYTDETFERLGPRVLTSSEADDPIKFGLLLDAALVEEQIEIDVAAGADAARRLRLGKAIGFGLGVGLGVLGVPSLIGSVAKELASNSSPGAKRSKAAASRPLGPGAHEGMVLSALSDAIDHPDRRADYGLSALSDTDWEFLRQGLIEIENATDADEHHDAIHNLKNHIAREIPAVDAMFTEIAKLPGMDHLRFGGVDVDPD